MIDKALQSRAIEIIRPLVPPDAEDRVRRSQKQWNQIVRDHIRTETGLKLADGDSRHAIPVRVLPGFPKPLADLIGQQHSDPVMWRLVIGQPKLGGLVQGLQFLLKDWAQVETWRSLPETAKNGQATLEQTLAIATSLQQAALGAQVLKQITEIQEDILGVYRLTPDQGAAVELYWLPIAMLAAMADVPIEDLTVVVLIHELAHGYTHLGRDIDGQHWTDQSFAESDLRVVEGLAQFYTEIISQKLSARTPGIYTAFQALLKFQSGAYLVHQNWLTDHRRQIGETVRFALIAARSSNRVSYDAWQRLMVRTDENLKRPPASS
jgi:hypothetical protein